MPKDPWKGVEPERREMAQSIFAAAKQIAEEDGDGEFNLSSFPPQLQSVGGGFNRLVSRAARGELDENDPKDVVDALRVASAALVDMRQPPQYQGFKWLTGNREPLVPEDWSERFRFAGEGFGEAVADLKSVRQPYGPQEGPQVGVPSWTDVTPQTGEDVRFPMREWPPEEGTPEVRPMRQWNP